MSVRRPGNCAETGLDELGVEAGGILLVDAASGNWLPAVSTEHSTSPGAARFASSSGLRALHRMS